MAKTPRPTLKNWFRNGLKPTQEHFWNWLDSFVHKDDKISISQVEELEASLLNTASANHTHADLANKDLSNLNEDDLAIWQDVFKDSTIGSVDDVVKLSDEYPGLGLASDQNQKDFNQAVDSKITEFSEEIPKKLPVPETAGTYIVQANGDGTFQWIPAGTVYRFMGSIPTYDDKPTDPNQGDVYNVIAADAGNGISAGDNIAWTGAEWDNLGGLFDASGYIENWEFEALENIVITTEPQTLTPEQQSQARLNIGVTGGGGESSSWGDIAGNIGDQTDLQLALELKSNVDHTHDYGDLENLPAIPGDISQLSDNESLLFSGDYEDLENKPTIPAQVNLIEGDNIEITGIYPDLTIKSTASGGGGGSSAWGEITGDIGDQVDLSDALDGKLDVDDTLLGLSNLDPAANEMIYATAPNVFAKTTITPFARTILDDANAAAVRATIGAGTGNGNGTVTSVAVGVGLSQIGSPSTSSTISLKNATSSEVGGVKVWKGTKAAYNALGTYDANTLYFIEDTETAEIAVFTIDTAYTINADASFSLSLATAISPAIWAKCYDWDITWRDAGGLHNLRDFQYAVINQIYLAGRNGGGDFDLSVDWRAGSVVIPVGAKLTLHLSDDAPIYSA